MRLFDDIRCSCQGVGLTEVDNIFSPNTYLAFAMFNIELFDADDFSLISRAPLGIAFRQTETATWTKPMSELTPAQDEALREHITSLLAVSIDERLRVMQLVQ